MTESLDANTSELLPILPTPPTPRPQRPWLGRMVHTLRLLLFTGIVLAIHLQGRQLHRLFDSFESPPLTVVTPLFPQASHLGTLMAETGLVPVFDAQQHLLGYLATTSPQADHILGFSGPTNVLLAFDPELQLFDTAVLWSRDTREHLAEVLKHPGFWDQFHQQIWSDLAQRQQFDTVSGATLTSLAIAESIVTRLGGTVPALRFPEPLELNEIQQLFPDAVTFAPATAQQRRWEVYGAGDSLLGSVISTSPAADQAVGYQGPTETLLALDPQEVVVQMRVRGSYDNEPYVSYLNDDWSWPELFAGKTLAEVATFDLAANGVEGVSGATFTSMAVARGVITTAAQQLQPPQTDRQSTERTWQLTTADVVSLTVVALGLLIALTHLRGNRRLRVAYQIVLIGTLGFWNGDLLSQAMLVGWAQHGLPWRTAGRLVCLAAVAFLFPTLLRRNVYCTHLCAHGAVQQLVRQRISYQWHPGRQLRRCLNLIPGLLLFWVLLVTLVPLGFSLVDIEPFDAYLFRIAGWSTISIAVIGGLASLFTPMAYCRYGCPTGALLNTLRRTSSSHQFHPSDAPLFAAFILSWALLLM